MYKSRKPTTGIQLKPKEQTKTIIKISKLKKTWFIQKYVGVLKVNVGPSSEMRAQHYTNIDLTSRVCWDRNSKSRFLQYLAMLILIPGIGKRQHHYLAFLGYKVLDWFLTVQ